MHRQALDMEALYREQVRRVHGFFYAYTGGDADWARDLVHDTFCAALRQAARYDPARGAPGAWLWAIARTTLLDSLRKRRRRGPIPPVEAIEAALLAATDAQPLADEILARKETRLRIGSVLATLSEEHRAVLRAKYLEDQSMQQIAEARGTTAKAVESMLTRARKAFRTEFLAVSAEQEEAR